MAEVVEVRVAQARFDDRSVMLVAELVGAPSEAEGITIAVGQGGTPKGIVRVHYPMTMVDPRMVEVAQHLLTNLASTDDRVVGHASLAGSGLWWRGP